jgi:hypothetical protein
MALGWLARDSWRSSSVFRGGRLTLKHVRLDGAHRETIVAADAPLPDRSSRPSRIYPTPGGARNDLSRESPDPHFCRFATEIAGKRLISDAASFDQDGRIFVAELGESNRDPLRDFAYLLSPESSCERKAHIHPFLSPDGSTAFFNSDESGIPRAYMARGL